MSLTKAQLGLSGALRKIIVRMYTKDENSVNRNERPYSKVPVREVFRIQDLITKTLKVYPKQMRRTF